MQGSIRRRYAGTDAVCREIDRSGKRSPEYIGLLYYCLGHVKDPASISWLEEKLRGGESPRIYKDWLRCWWTYARGADHCQLKWLKAPDRWAAFFRQQITRENNPEHRLALLKVLAGWFHDQETIRFFLALDKAPGTQGETFLVTQVYLHQHKRPTDAARLSSAIEAVRSQRRGNEALIEYAKELRHEAFLPFLVSLVPAVLQPHLEHVFTESDDVQYALEKITLRLDVRDRAGWQAWYEKHRGESRDVWLRQAASEFEAIADKDPREARKFFDKALHRWDDRALLPWVQRWTKYRFLHSYLMGWVNLSYHPFWRNDLRPIVEAIIHEDGDKLEPWARHIPKDLDFIPNDETWERQLDFHRI